MCELFAINSKKNMKINRYLTNFYKHCEKNPHGWGLAQIYENKTIIDKQPVKATQSTYLKKLLSKPIQLQKALAHIRLATTGKTDTKNCHPFIYKDNTDTNWILIHNGTIFNSPELEKYRQTQNGLTDSERILMYVVDRINEIIKIKKRKPTDTECFNLISQIIQKLSKNNKLNIIIYNDSAMFIHTNCEEEGGGLKYHTTQNRIIITTQKLDNNNNWKKVPVNTLYMIKDGEIQKKGKKHENRYTPTRENLKFILENTDPELKKIILENFKTENTK